LQRLLDADPQGADAAELRWLLADRHAAAAAPRAPDLAAYSGSYGEEASITSEDGALILHRGRRAATLRPIAADLFVSALDPLMHAQFERQGGRVVALTLVTPTGPAARFTRLAATAGQ
jgi:hypothetical protein